MSPTVLDVVERWCPFELSLDGPDDEAMYREEPVSAVFSTGTRDVFVRGFYDGGDSLRTIVSADLRAP